MDSTHYGLGSIVVLITYLGDISGLLNSEKSEATDVQCMLCPAAVLGLRSCWGSYNKSLDIIDNTFLRLSRVLERYLDVSSLSTNPSRVIFVKTIYI